MEIDLKIVKQFFKDNDFYLYGKYSKPHGVYAIGSEWDDGGMSGGSCWGDTALPFSGSRYGGDPVGFDDAVIHQLLELVCPDITYLQYRKLSSIMETYFTNLEWEDREYYGNYTNKCAKFITYDNMLKSFRDMGWNCDENTY